MRTKHLRPAKLLDYAGFGPSEDWRDAIFVEGGFSQQPMSVGCWLQREGLAVDEDGCLLGEAAQATPLRRPLKRELLHPYHQSVPSKRRSRQALELLYAMLLQGTHVMHHPMKGLAHMELSSLQLACGMFRPSRAAAPLHFRRQNSRSSNVWDSPSSYPAKAAGNRTGMSSKHNKQLKRLCRLVPY